MLPTMGSMKHQISHFIVALTASTEAGGVPRDIQLIPAGSFRSSDGRPEDVPAWQLTAASAEQLLLQAANRANPYLIDFEHQTLLSKQNGQPAPAAGWFTALDYRPGTDAKAGLWATGVAWTARARAMIAAGEYKFISPVFTYDASGCITRLLHAALTNDPALDGMAAVAAAYQHTPTTEALMMDDLIERLQYLLNLPITTTPEELAAELDKLKAMITADGTAAASFGGLMAHLTALADRATAADAQLVALTASHQPTAVVEALKAQVATLTADLSTRQLDALIAPALADGRLLPAQEGWARKQSVAALSEYLATTAPIAALTTLQSGGTPPGDALTALTAEEQTACRLLGQTEADYARFKG